MNERKLWAEQVLATLSVLSTLESEIVRLTYFSHLSQAATAARLDVALPTVKSVLADALCALGSALEVTP
jgi:DNA-directed RNA polymerase specialized sigma24 family protein